MDEEQVKKYTGKKVLLILKNNYKFTVIIPKFNGPAFEITDKFGQRATIECDMISMIYEKEGEDDGRR